MTPATRRTRTSPWYPHQHQRFEVHRHRSVVVLPDGKDYLTPPNCTSPFAPTWITEMVRRQHDK